MDWPSTLVPYRRTDEFTEETIPAGLQKEHNLADGTWAMIRVLDGELAYIDLENGREISLNTKAPGFIEPQQRHRIEARGAVRFYIEFFRDANIADEPTT